MSKWAKILDIFSRHVPGTVYHLVRCSASPLANWLWSIDNDSPSKMEAIREDLVKAEIISGTEGIGYLAAIITSIRDGEPSEVVPSEVVPSEGVKYDEEKPRWWLLPIEPVIEIVKVLTYAARKKYSDENWKKVPNAKERYFSALMRHIVAYRSGEQFDNETGLYHLAHGGCCLLFLLWHELNSNVLEVEQ